LVADAAKRKVSAIECEDPHNQVVEIPPDYYFAFAHKRCCKRWAVCDKMSDSLNYGIDSKGVATL
jgi:hypothetical protein